MRILETLSNEEITGAEKLKSIISLVDVIRAKYGNTDEETETTKVATAEGYVGINLLTTDEKVAVATGRIKTCISRATAEAEDCKGSVFDREFERFVAVDAVLTNLGMESDSEY